MINNFVFDLGNVLLAFDFERFHSRIESAGGTVTDAQRARHLEMRDAFESGKLTDEKFVEKSSKLFNYPGPPDQFIRCWEDIFTVNEPMLDVVAALRAQNSSLFILSNTNNLHVRFIQRNFDVLSLFDKHIYSHEVGCMKPETEIYRITAAHCDIDPTRTLFVDDRHDNTGAASGEGFITHTYNIAAHNHLLTRLSELGVAINVSFFSRA